MNTIVLYPANALQLTFLQELVEKLRVKFSSITKKQDDSLFTKEAYFAMLDASIQEAKEGKVHRMKEGQTIKEFLNELCTN